MSQKWDNLLVPNGKGIMCLEGVAMEFGVLEALFLQQLYYLTRPRAKGRLHEGKRWVYYSYEQWIELYLPYINERKLRRIIASLEQQGAIQSAQLGGTFSRVKYYTIPEDVVVLFQKVA